MITAGKLNPNESNESYLNEAESTHRKSTIHANCKKRVLVVDDDAMIRDFLNDALSVLGYEVTTAPGGAEGLDQFGQNAFDLVITDCLMPGTDGWQMAERIRQISASTPIIMVTGQNEDEVRPKMQGGNIDFLVFKPFKLDKLYEAVRASFELK